MDKLISITPTRQTLKSERGDFNILREHLKTNRLCFDFEQENKKMLYSRVLRARIVSIADYNLNVNLSQS